MKSALSPGDRIADKYRILSTLGSGGMGVVYLAQHERLDRPVAIKFLHAQLERRGAAVKRFEREIKAMALVNNRHIGRALDADVQEDGSLFLVMEYLEGHNLRAELNLRRAVPFSEAVAYVIQACEGIAAVHDLGIIHRDLKPHNLFLTELSGARCIKVLDFGIAKFSENDGATTETDVALGTPRYMSPEQLTNPENVSPRSDVWALGVVLYELIAGTSPFSATTPGAVVAAVVLDEPVWLSKVVAAVPEELARVVADALAKSPKNRIAGVRELARRLLPFSMPTDAIFVAAPASAPAPAAMLDRKSLRPELATQIEHEVAAFDGNVGSGDSDTPPDARRKLPSLAKLAIRRGSDDSPTQRPPASASTPAAPAAVSRPPQRRGMRAASALALVCGLLLAALVSRARPRDAAEASRLPAPVSRPVPTTSAALPLPISSVVQSARPAAEPSAAPTLSRQAMPAPARSTAQGPARPRAARSSSPARPSAAAAPPLAADGKPLHL
jgi:eukaryotic-like serine/threonine-protein kinase